jgi:hypothetical protein
MAGKVIVKIDGFGNTEVSTEGIAGAACLAASQSVEQALAAGGGKKGDDKKTGEFYQPEQQAGQGVSTNRW